MLTGIVGFIIAITGVIAGILALLSDELKQNKRLKYILVAVLLAFSIYAMLGSLLDLQSNSAQTSESIIPVAVDSTKDWQNTGIMLQKGNTFIVTVVGGKWTVAREQIASGELPEKYLGYQVWALAIWENPGDGGATICLDYGVPNCPVPTSKVGLLVGKIGFTGEPFPIGSKKTIIAPASGLLLLRVNDGEKEGFAGLGDNSGVLAVEIDVQE